MKSALQAIAKGIQMALQLDFFSDFLVPDRLQPEPKKPPSSAPFAPNAANTPQTFVNTTNKRRILLQDFLLEYELRRSKRRSIGFLITDDGLRITAPRWVTMADIEVAIHEKQRWIINKLTERREREQHSLRATMRWEDGAKLPYLGYDIELKIASAQRAGVHFDAEQKHLIVSLPMEASEQQLKDRVQSWLQQEAKRVFLQRLPVFAEKLGVQYRSMSLSSATTRWGSCTSDGKIRLNWRLIHFSPEVIDYVVAHELAHLREMNHSPRFWQTVQSVFPEFESAKQTLRHHAKQQLPEF